MPGPARVREDLPGEMTPEQRLKEEEESLKMEWGQGYPRQHGQRSPGQRGGDTFGKVSAVCGTVGNQVGLEERKGGVGGWGQELGFTKNLY